ncbi:PadR family transcriptional regulator [candidate division KSB1 bacterium]
MNDKIDKKDELLRSWEETYKKGQLTFWLLLSLREKPRYVGEIKEFIEKMTEGSISCEDQSLYRALRKFNDLKIVDYELGEGHKGPERKYYVLTALGRELLSEFIKRNISILYNKELAELLSKAENPSLNNNEKQ